MINCPSREKRLAAAEELGAELKAGKLSFPRIGEVNNHVHTKYSFSPYYPAAAAMKAVEAGLGIVGSIDHDSIGAAEEMLEAGAKLGIATTVGFEVRVSFLSTPIGDRKINNPDSKGYVYMCVHGVPRHRIKEVEAFLKPINVRRGLRNRQMLEGLSSLGFDLDYDKDVLPLSEKEGSVTERHILYALSLKIIEKYGKGKAVVDYLKNELHLALSPKVEGFLLDKDNPHYAYDLLGVFKSALLPRFYIQPDESECIPAREVVDFAKKIGAIPAYAYLGDVTASPTGDKKAEQFEDSYLDQLFKVLADLGYLAVTYMPPRNTAEQMERVQKYCRQYGLMEISGVDVNSSRQVMNCPELLKPQCAHLIDSAWALVAHEKMSETDEKYGLFSPLNPIADLPLEKRISVYAEIGKSLDPYRPFESAAECAKKLSAGEIK